MTCSRTWSRTSSWVSSPSSSAFFSMVRGHTLQGTFCDPIYGGNANMVGWDLIGYPGVRLSVTAAEQNMSTPAAAKSQIGVRLFDVFENGRVTRWLQGSDAEAQAPASLRP